MSVTLHTNLGDIKLELYCEKAPKASEANEKNFLALCASGYYNGCIFHRNIPGFMLQGGDPTGTGKGGTSIWNKPFEDEFRDDLLHDTRGILAMANKGPNTNLSQFYITYAPQPHLNNVSTVFGKVIYGTDTLSKMEKVPTGKKDIPLPPGIKIESVTIHANPIAPLF